MKKSISDFFYDACIRDDRTGLASTTKFIRMGTWFLGVIFVFATLIISCIKELQLTSEDISVLSLCKEFLIFFCGFAESSYQFNRNQKMKHGTLPLVSEKETPKEEERKRIDL